MYNSEYNSVFDFKSIEADLGSGKLFSFKLLDDINRICYYHKLRTGIV